MTNRNKYLTEAMGECWHEFLNPIALRAKCVKCGHSVPVYGWGFRNGVNPDFSTWTWCGKLFEFMAKEKYNKEFFEWYKYEICDGCCDYYITWSESTPDLCANAIYKFLSSHK